MKTYTPKPGELKKKWYLVDAKDKVLGRLASEVAKILRGKNKPQFTPHLDLGDFVVVINADKVVLTGKKEKTKTYYHHTGYPGGLKAVSFSKFIREKPEELFTHAVKGMLPHNRLGTKILSKLFVYRGEEHPHQAQKPEPLIIGKEV
ncbi:50S ribosomal protein L13 [candidate division WOR-1 bacterium DG_54_3]|uniref:Large ribosomal subunit protein uL13 n=1 Tax=candidate division WOR-1 bacterium DG_54_3 TaxID=1703775 RepID=A0A0S7Y2J5_UNCSA|nr:MAG: 50S ribosomal protein L13 [candidate division WOR-1 bacterium DG_54_3]